MRIRPRASSSSNESWLAPPVKFGSIPNSLNLLDHEPRRSLFRPRASMGRYVGAGLSEGGSSRWGDRTELGSEDSVLGALIIVFREVIEAGIIVGSTMAVTRGVPARGRYIGAGVAVGVLGACL